MISIAKYSDVEDYNLIALPFTKLNDDMTILDSCKTFALVSVDSKSLYDVGDNLEYIDSFDHHIHIIVGGSTLCYPQFYISLGNLGLGMFKDIDSANLFLHRLMENL